ncbi:MAG: hypothetical protein ABJF11_04510 [Reichenbachiella sp.]|uniref:hypothetical protein n=1 Tax=Reichenbachiella sp. TaxID=2184521 RepID=UPI0032664E7D
MKTLWLSLLILMMSLQIFAQNELQKMNRVPRQMYYGELSTNDFFKKSDYIFEGSVISHKDIVNNDSTLVWTSTLLEVTHVLKGKGEIQTGQIELIRNCGLVYTKDKSELLLEYNWESCLKTYGKMVYFCKKSPVAYQSTNNTIAVKPLENLPDAALYFTDMRMLNFKVYGLDHKYFKTQEDFYRFAAKKKGITVPNQYQDSKKKASLRVGSVDEFSNPRLAISRKTVLLIIG